MNNTGAYPTLTFITHLSDEELEYAHARWTEDAHTNPDAGWRERCSEACAAIITEVHARALVMNSSRQIGSPALAVGRAYMLTPSQDRVVLTRHFNNENGTPILWVRDSAGTERLVWPHHLVDIAGPAAGASVKSGRKIRETLVARYRRVVAWLGR
jgi:hypothetical protein